VLGLERTFGGKTKVLGLHRGQLGQLDVDVSQVQSSDLFVENLWENVDTDIELSGLAELWELLSEGSVSGLVQQDLGENLVGE
jgi:hypothetical protein